MTTLLGCSSSHSHREGSALTQDNERSEESDQVRFLRASCVSSVRVVPHRFYLLPSYFFLRVLPKWNILSIHFSLSLAFVFIIVF